MQRILVLDNYDSFTYNLVHIVEKITLQTVDVFYNNAIDLAQIKTYDKIILSPGPGIPEEAGILLSVIKVYASTKSILGVCLGHQAIAQAFGGKLINMENVYHGIATKCSITKKDCALFNGLEDNFEIGRYHSWVADAESLPDELEITAVDENGLIMALQHKIYDVKGVQFHPESVLTPTGEKILANWLLEK